MEFLKFYKELKMSIEKKIFIHFERVWQTENESTEKSKSLLRTIIKDFITEGVLCQPRNI